MNTDYIHQDREYERMFSPEAVKRRSRELRILEAVVSFPETFGLRAFPGRRFKINRSASYISGGEIVLYVYTEEGKAFCKGSPEELRQEVVA